MCWSAWWCPIVPLGSVHFSSREGNGTPLQYSSLENLMDGGAWWAAVHGVAKSRARLSNFTLSFHFHALEKEMAPTPVFLPGESQGWGSLVGAVYGVAQSRTRLKRLSSSNNVTKFCTSSSHLSVLSYSYLLPCLFSSPGMIAWVYESGFTQTLGPREIFLEQVHNKHFLQGGCGVRS